MGPLERGQRNQLLRRYEQKLAVVPTMPSVFVPCDDADPAAAGCPY